MSTLFAFGTKSTLLVAASGVAVAAAGAIAWRVAMHPPSIEFRPAPTVEAVVPPAPAVMTPSAPVVPPPVAAKPNVGPTFDVVRVEPTGEAVIAGRAAPGAHVRLLDQGQSIADGTADAAGQFVLMPVLAPISGGFLQDWYGWRAGFAVMATLGIVFGSLVFLLLPETNQRVRETPFSLAGVRESYGIVLRNKAYRAYLGIQACSYNGIFGFIAASSYILQRVYGLSASRFGLTFAMCSCSFVVGSFVGSRMVGRRGLDGMIGLGVACQFAAGVAQVAALALAPENYLSVVVPYMLFFVGVGLLLPQTQAAALTPFPERAGAASSMIGFVQMASGAFVGTILGAALGGTAWPLAILTLLAGGLGFAVFHLSAAARRDFAPVTRSFPRR